MKLIMFMLSLILGILSLLVSIIALINQDIPIFLGAGIIGVLLYLCARYWETRLVKK